MVPKRRTLTIENDSTTFPYDKIVQSIQSIYKKFHDYTTVIAIVTIKQIIQSYESTHVLNNVGIFQIITVQNNKCKLI